MKHAIPDSVLKQHIAVLGKTGSGKTSTAKLIVEQVVADGARVCVLDPIKSDWWGITSSSDGKRPGLPFHILGGPHGHVPLHAQAGRAIGEIIGSGQLPLSILDMADFEMGGLQRFFVEFAPSLIRKMTGVLYLVIEEAHEFAPKERAGFGQENMAIHFAKKLATAGRSKGIRLIIATQRTQSLHNAVLGSCDTMIAHRLIAPADQEPVNKWLSTNLPKEKAKEVASSLSSLKTGEAWICSGESGLFERRHFPRISTYDNTATPDSDAGDVTVKTAEVDRDKLRAIIGTAVEEAKANDPAELKKKISELQLNIAKMTSARLNAPPERERVEVKVPNRDALDAFEVRLQMAIGTLKSIEAANENHFESTQRLLSTQRESLESSITEIKSQVSGIHRQGIEVPRPERHLVVKNFNTAAPETNGKLGKCERAILSAVSSRFPDKLTRPQIAVLSQYSITSSGFLNSLSALRTAGYIVNDGDRITLTAAGADISPPSAPQSTDVVRQEWLNRVGKCERAILTELFARYPCSLDRETLAAKSGYSVTSSGFLNALSKLRTLELITRDREPRAADILFES